MNVKAIGLMVMPYCPPVALTVISRESPGAILCPSRLARLPAGKLSSANKVPSGSACRRVRTTEVEVTTWKETSDVAGAVVCSGRIKSSAVVTAVDSKSSTSLQAASTRTNVVTASGLAASGGAR